MSPILTLNYLDFDTCEDEHGQATFDTMASTGALQVAAVHAEIALVLAWAFANFPDQRAPLDEGGEWDYLLQGQQEWSAAQAVVYDAASGQVRVESGAAGLPRNTVSLSISGSPQFCAAFRQRFDLS
jgi:hypothetical protein